MYEQYGSLSSIKISGLRGRKDVFIKLEQNTLIIVGENGAGKTTILRIIFYFLSGNYIQLLNFQFNTIEAVLNGNPYTLTKRQLEETFLYDAKLVNRLSPALRNRLRQAQLSGRMEEYNAIMENFASRSLLADRPDDDLFSRVGSLQTDVQNQLGAQILYLPTYRRIERELNSIFAGADEDGIKRLRRAQPTDSDTSYIELVEFGMSDVEHALNANLDDIRRFSNARLHSLTLTYLGEIVEEEYENYSSVGDFQRDPYIVTNVLNRVSNEILNSTQKDAIFSTLTNRSSLSDMSFRDKIIHHYFSKLMKFHSELQQREVNIARFCDICNDYITDKKFIYDSRKFEFRIEWVGNKYDSTDDSYELDLKTNNLKLADLSSGEKQIVSLFSHLYLSGIERFFVLIDEPELSLSVPWQRRFLQDIRDGSFCVGVIAVTHSPFIYDNTLRPFARAIGEFISGDDWGNVDEHVG